MCNENQGQLKSMIVNGIVAVSIGIYALNRGINSSARISLKTRIGWNHFVTKSLSFNRENRFYTTLTYPLNHQTFGHLAFNASLVYMLGSELVKSHSFDATEVACLTSSAAVMAALAEAPFLRNGSSLIGASGVAMGYLGCLALSSPGKEWTMIFPIPGLTLTTLQLFQVVSLGHIVALAIGCPAFITSLALRGHVAGLLTGSTFSILFGKTPSKFDFIENSKKQWRKTIGWPE